jgi:monofunctional glycosyltransferase
MPESPYRRILLFIARDRSLGWARLESRQAAALGRLVSAGPPEGFPRELAPLPVPAKARRGILGWTRLVLSWIVAIHAWYLLSAGLCIFIYRFADPPVTVLMAYRKWGYGWTVQEPKPLPLKKVPAYLRSMLVAVEDGKFYQHHGLDFEAFARAREINARLGRPLYGGSTLTMQVARTLFLVPVKSYARKYLEVLTALELEALLSKSRILELYFGYAEWGKGIFGVERAARADFGESVTALGRDQAARLVALLSSPIKYKPNTLEKSGILRERYRYLSKRFDSESPYAEKAQDAGPSGAGAIGAARAAASGTAAAGGSGGSAAEAPPPSIEPDESEPAL